MPSVLQDMVSVPLTGVTSGTGNVTTSAALFVILLIFPIFFVINYFLTQHMFYIVYCNWSSFNLSVTCGFSGYSGFPPKNKTDRSI